jgi:hypothetical protein
VGSNAVLTVGRITLDERKFNGFDDEPGYSALFQRSDIVVREATSDDQVLMWPLVRKPLEPVIDRLELLGYSCTWVERRLSDLISLCYEGISGGNEPSRDSLNAESLASAIERLNVNDERPASHDGLEYYIWFTLEDHLNREYGLPSESEFFRPLISRLGAYTTLRLLGANKENIRAVVEWDYGEGVVNEYVTADTFPTPLVQGQQFLLVTEGRSDSRILMKALELRRRHVRDFFYFADMTEGYPFGGTGNLHNFCKGLSAIDVQNRTIIIYDNDAEGISKFHETAQLNTPRNIRVMHLPTLTAGETVDALGPTGVSTANVNETAASTEYYLDLASVARSPQIRWTNYVQRIDRYQGALVGKEDYSAAFEAWTPGKSNYCFEKLDLCIDAIVELAKGMAAELLPENDKSYVEF